MKTFIPLLIALFFAVALSAQTPQSFRYQAVARDNSGNVLDNQKVSFQISVLTGTVSGATAYSETHTGLITNAFGLVELEIGKGTPVTGNFSAINWGGNTYFVKVEMDPAGGSSWQTLSTSQLLSVPYALHAKTVETGDQWGSQTVVSDATLTGAGTTASNLKLAQQGATSGQVLKWNGSSWLPSADNAGTDVWQVSGSNIYRLTGRVGIGTATPTAYIHVKGTGAGGGSFLAEGLFKEKQDAPPVAGAGTRMMWYSDKAAFRAGEVAGTNWDKDSVGNHSVAMGYDVRAKGIASAAIGNQAKALGNYSIALGSAALASGIRSTAIGSGTTASGMYSTALGPYGNATGSFATTLGYVNNAEGDYSMALGDNTTAYSMSEMVVGSNNTSYTPVSKTAWDPSDRLFVIGNGSGGEGPHNALTMLKSGKTGIGTDTPAALLHTYGSTVGNGNVLFEGLYDYTNARDLPANNDAARLFWYPDKSALMVGRFLNADWHKDSIGSYSFAMGNQTKATKSYAFAFGSYVRATGQNAVALGGYGGLASGNSSVAIGGGAATAHGAVSIKGTATGSSSMAFRGKAESYYSIAMGYNNVGGGDPDSWVTTDPLFELGNGYLSTAQNAMTILKNGNVGIGSGALKPEYLLSIGGNGNGINLPVANMLSFHTRSVERVRIDNSGNIGIGTTSPAVKLHLQNSTGDLRLRMQSNSGNEIQFYDNAGTFEASVGYSKTQGHLYMYNGGNVAVKDGKLGVGTITPQATLDVNGSAKIGPSGVKIGEMIEITGTLFNDLGWAAIYYPAGYNWENTRVMSAEYFEDDVGSKDYWASYIEYTFFPDYLHIDFPNDGDTGEKFRAILMRVDP